jgi:hypothetical protein
VSHLRRLQSMLFPSDKGIWARRPLYLRHVVIGNLFEHVCDCLFACWPWSLRRCWMRACWPVSLLRWSGACWPVCLRQNIELPWTWRWFWVLLALFPSDPPLQDDCKNWTLETCLLALLLSAVTQHDYVVEPRY